MKERDHQPGTPTAGLRPAGLTIAEPTAWMDQGQLARFRGWQDRTFHADPRKVIWARRYSAFLAVALAALATGIGVLAFRASAALVSVVPIVLALLWAWGHASFALHGPPPPGPPRLPTEFRLCPVCGSILRVRQLEYGWTAVCPACDYRLLLED